MLRQTGESDGSDRHNNSFRSSPMIRSGVVSVLHVFTFACFMLVMCLSFATLVSWGRGRLSERRRPQVVEPARVRLLLDRLPHPAEVQADLLAYALFVYWFVYWLLTLLDLCVSSLRRGHANLLCIVAILTDDPRRESLLLSSLLFTQSPCRQGGHMWAKRAVGERGGRRRDRERSREDTKKGHTQSEVIKFHHVKVRGFIWSFIMWSLVKLCGFHHALVRPWMKSWGRAGSTARANRQCYIIVYYCMLYYGILYHSIL